VKRTFPNPRFTPRDISPELARRSRSDCASTWSAFDPAQLVAPLAVDQGESSWYCFEGTGRGARGPRRVAGLIWIHRTGPRASRFSLGPSVISRDALPARWRDLVPSWLPIIAPIDLGLDDRPLFMVALYDLDDRNARPLQIELPVEHADFDAATFSAATAGCELELHQYAPNASLPGGLRAFFDGDSYATSVQARCDAFELQLHVRAGKPVVTFGDDGSPCVRHGPIEVGYAQRSRLDILGSISLAGEAITDFVADGAHDRHWRASTVLGLRWLWMHLRLRDRRELVAYVIRETRGGALADADADRELGRGAWLVEGDAAVHRIDHFELGATAHADTSRGRIPTRFALDVAALELSLVFEHALSLPYLPMRAFGDLADLGIYEGPIHVVTGACEGGWLEIVTPPAFNDRALSDPRRT
jgi:hypothetical protein